MADDYLAQLTEEQVAAWYGRLADVISKKKVSGSEPFAATLMKTYLRNRDPKATCEFDAPDHLKSLSYVLGVQKFHRDVFLTKQKGSFSGSEKWVGVLPRIQGWSGFTKWNLSSTLDLTYESLVEVGSGYADLVRIQLSGTDQERDIFASLRGFQLKSAVKVVGAKASASKVKIIFQSWSCSASDRYDFDYSEHLKMPNPDYGSKAKDAVRPGDESIEVYHKNAKRIEDKGLAAPFDVAIKPWIVTDASLLRAEEIDPARKLR